ncbi:MAG: hypothetical protein LBM99_02985, partial [Bacillales bacterium]|nr:hypothetical protein [Bacillales bacterium]
MKKHLSLFLLFLVSCTVNNSSSSISESIIESTNDSSIESVSSSLESTSIESSSSSISESSSSSLESTSTESSSSSSSDVSSSDESKIFEHYPADFANIHYDLSCFLSDDIQTATATMTISFTSLININNLYFHLFTNMYLESNGGSGVGHISKYGSLTVNKVYQGEKNYEFEYKMNNQGLFIPLDVPLNINDTFTISIDYSLLIPTSDSRL